MQLTREQRFEEEHAELWRCVRQAQCAAEARRQTAAQAWQRSPRLQSRHSWPIGVETRPAGGQVDDGRIPSGLGWRI